MKSAPPTAGDSWDDLSGSGLFLATGPFTFRIQSQVSEIANGIRLLYDSYPASAHSEFADFHIRFDSVRPCGRGFRRHVSVEVDGESPSLPVPVEQAYAVFEGCLNWCIYSHAYQYLIIHAAALERGGRAVMMPAPPGSGKSTLCAALASKGWRLLTDELTLIATDTRTIVPLARPVSLKNESIDIIKRFSPSAVFGPVSANTVKGTIAHMRAPGDSVARVGEHGRAVWLVVPSYRASAPTTASPVSKGEAFMRVAESAVNYMALGELGFRLVSSLIDEMSCYRFEYSDLDDAVRWFDGLGE